MFGPIKCYASEESRKRDPLVKLVLHPCASTVHLSISLSRTPNNAQLFNLSLHIQRSIQGHIPSCPRNLLDPLFVVYQAVRSRIHIPSNPLQTLLCTKPTIHRHSSNPIPPFGTHPRLRIQQTPPTRSRYEPPRSPRSPPIAISLLAALSQPQTLIIDASCPSS